MGQLHIAIQDKFKRKVFFFQSQSLNIMITENKYGK